MFSFFHIITFLSHNYRTRETSPPPTSPVRSYPSPSPSTTPAAPRTCVLPSRLHQGKRSNLRAAHDQKNLHENVWDRVVASDYATYVPPNLYGRDDARGSSARGASRGPPPEISSSASAYDTYRPAAAAPRRGPPPRAPAAPRRPAENDYAAYDTYRPPAVPSKEYARKMDKNAGARIDVPSRDERRRDERRRE